MIIRCFIKGVPRAVQSGWVMALRWWNLSSADLRWRERQMRNQRRNERYDCGALNCRSVQRNGPRLFYSLIFMLAIINIWLMAAYSQWKRGDHRVGECVETLTYVHLHQTNRKTTNLHAVAPKQWTNWWEMTNHADFPLKFNTKLFFPVWERTWWGSGVCWYTHTDWETPSLTTLLACVKALSLMLY